MKPHQNQTKDPFKEKPGSKRKRVDKPWRFSYKIVDDSYISWRKEPMNEWIDQWYSGYSSVEHALQQLNKEMRSYFFIFKNRHMCKEIRLINKETGEIILLEVKDNEVIIKQS